MAARWGAGEEILNACSLDLFATNTLDENICLNSEALQTCIDPSILSIFEDPSTGEAKGLDLESEATLLTALTEILDNVDDENLSPFDTLPDSDLLSGHKGGDNSPLRRLLCLSRSPPEKDIGNAWSFSNGKSLPRIQAGSVQRSDGEDEEDGSLTPRQLSSLDKELRDWGGLTVPLSFAMEEEGADEDGGSISLGDFVRTMHPYCVTLCVGDGESEQMLPEGGIFLEVVDTGEDGEAILAVPALAMPLSLPLMQDTRGNEHNVPNESKEASAGNAEDDIVVVDEEEDIIVSDSPVETACTLTPVLSSDVEGDVDRKRPRGPKPQEMGERNPSRRTGKGRKDEQTLPVERRVLRSASAKKAAQELPLNPKAVGQKKNKSALVSLASILFPSPTCNKSKACKITAQPEVPKQALPSETKKATAQTASSSGPLQEHTSASRDRPVNCSPAPVNSPQPNEMATKLAPPPGKQEVLSTVSSVGQPPPPQVPLPGICCLAGGAPQTLEPLKAALSPVVPETTEMAPPAPEPKPKALSLAEYRRLRQQKKLPPVEKPAQYSTKWPTLPPELPKELSPIPCLPDPTPRDSRRPTSTSGEKEAPEIKTAWQPMGPGVPPTPEALLAPPAYMVASSNKCGSATTLPKPQQTSVPQPDAVSKPPQPSSSAASKHPQPQPLSSAASKPPQPQPWSSAASKPPQPQPLSSAASKPPQPQPLSSAASKPPQPQPLSSAALSTVKNIQPSLNGNLPPAKPYVPVSAGPISCARPVSLMTPPSETPPSTAPSRETSEVQQRPRYRPVTPTCVIPNEVPSKATTETPKPTIAAVPVPVPSSAPPKPTAVAKNVPPSIAATSVSDPATSTGRPSITTVLGGLLRLPRTACSAKPSQKRVSGHILLGAHRMLAKAPMAQKAKSPMQAIIDAFTTEIGIEAADLTSLLEQFEETQAKEEHCVPEVSGRAAAVGNSSVKLPLEKSPVERVRANNTYSTAALTPPATPPHQLWKPLAPVALVGKSKALDDSKAALSKVIQIEARPLPSGLCRSKPTTAAAMVSPHIAFLDHDYCLSNAESSANEPGKRWNVQQQPSITIKTIKQHEETTVQKQSTAALPKAAQASLLDDRAVDVSVLPTPDASPARQESDAGPLAMSPGRGPSGRHYRRHTPTRSPSLTPASGDRKRGRPRRRGACRSPSPASSGSESHSQSSESRSRSPPKKKYRPRHSGSSSASSSSSSRSVSRSPPRRRRHSYSSSHSGSWSCSRSPSCSPQRRTDWRRGRIYSPSYRPGYRNSSRETPDEAKRRKEKAIEERRVVYVGRIRGTMTRRELRERFSYFGEIEDCTLHFRDHGDNYGFVTYYDTKDAFMAIENGGKLRNPDELPFDLCFGGRRQFCQSSYSDLDSNREYGSAAAKDKFNALDFDTLLKQAQKNQKR